MDKKLEDYLHLYLGCECVNTYGQVHMLTVDNFKTLSVFGKPVLRLLNDMSNEELNESYKLRTDNLRYFGAFEFKYLLDNHFDLFGLIPEGLAIDATTLKK